MEGFKTKENQMSYEKIDRKAPEILTAISNAPIYGKVGEVKARKAAAGEKIATILDDGTTETENVANEGDFIVTNPSGEEYIIAAKKFEARYKATDKEGVYAANGYCKAIKNPTGKPIEIMASWGEPQFGGADCMLADVCDENGDQMDMEPYIIDGDAFVETYVMKL